MNRVGNAQNIDTFRKATHARAFRISAQGNEDRWGKASVDDYPTVSGPVSIPAAERIEIQKLLSDKDSIEWDYA